MYSYMGYGIACDKIIWPFEAYSRLYRMIQDKNSYLCELIGQYTEDHSFSSEEEAFPEFCDDFVDETSLAGGIESVLIALINEQEFGHKKRFLYEDHIIHVAETLPIDEEDKETLPTQKEIAKILNDYAGTILGKTQEVKWYEIRPYG